MRSWLVIGRGPEGWACHLTEAWQLHPMRPPVRLVALSVLTLGTGDDERIVSYTFHGADGNVYRWHVPSDQWYVHAMCPEA